MGRGFQFGIKVWLLLLALFSAMPIAAFSAYAVVEFAHYQQRALTEELTERARIAAGGFGLRLETLTATLTALARFDAARLGDLAGFHAHARREAAYLRGVSAIVLIGPKGENLFNTNVDWGGGLPPIPARDSAARAFATGRPSVSDLFVAPVRKVPVAAIDIPVQAADGTMAYVLRATVESSFFDEVMVGLDLPSGWTLVVVDGSGTIISRNRDADHFVGTRTAASVRDAIARSESRPFSSITHDGIEVWAMVAPIRPWPWSVAIGVPERVLTAPLRQSLSTLAVGAATSGLAGLILVIWLSRHLVREVRAALSASLAMAPGARPVAVASSIRELETIGVALETAIEREERAGTEMKALAESERRLAESNTALAEKARQLASSNADLEQFAYVASHDLQTPLRNIVSYTQLLERRYRGQLGGDADEFIGFIIDSSKQMTRLIADLLEYSRASRQSEPMVPTSAADAVALALGSLRFDVERTGAEIVVGDLPRVMADQTHLVSLFQNLMENALKYRSPDRSPRVAVSAEAVPGGMWRFVVADNGIGVDPAYHDKIFEIFQRLDPTAGTEGTGIGLTLCRRIVDRFGGEIGLDSRPGQGSTFWFTLRAAT